MPEIRHGGKPSQVKNEFRNKLARDRINIRNTFLLNVCILRLNMSEYEIKPVNRKDLPPARVGRYDKIKADLEKREKGIYEISVEGKKVMSIHSSLKKKLDPKKFKVFLRSGRCFVEVL